MVTPLSCILLKKYYQQDIMRKNIGGRHGTKTSKIV